MLTVVEENKGLRDRVTALETMVASNANIIHGLSMELARVSEKTEAITLVIHAMKDRPDPTPTISERDQLRVALDELGITYHVNAGVASLQKKLDEARSASKEG